MKKITEELNRYNSINQYISEQYSSPGIADFPKNAPTAAVKTAPANAITPIVLSAYKIILDGFSGMGTKPKYIIDGLNQLKDSNQFIELNNLFVTNKPDGYASFQDMINGEFEYTDSVSTNENDLNKIYTKLKSLGIMSTIGKVNNRHKEGSYKITLPTKTAVVDSKTAKTGDPAAVKNTKQPVKISPVLQQTMSFNKQIQQKTGVTPTGKLTHADLEKLIGMLRPAATTSTSGEITPAGTVASTQTTPTASTLPQQQK